MQGSREREAGKRIGLRGVVKARRYSPRQNLHYMSLAFTSPRRLLEGFLLETSLLYGLVPFASFVIAYEFLYIWNYLQQRPLAFARLLPVPEQAYYLYQALFAPLINVANVLVFAGVLTVVAQLAGCQDIIEGPGQMKCPVFGKKYFRTCSPRPSLERLTYQPEWPYRL